MMLEVRNLSAGYGKKTILHDVSFSLEAGTMTGLLGSNGISRQNLSQFHKAMIIQARLFKIQLQQCRCC